MKSNSYDNDNWGMPTTGSSYNNKNTNNTSLNSTNSTATRNTSIKNAHHDSEDSDFSENVKMISSEKLK